MLSLTLPKSERHPLTRLTFSHPSLGETHSTFDDSFSHVEIPDEMSGDEVEIVCHFCDGNGNADMLMVGILMKERIVHEVPKEPVGPPVPNDATDGEVSGDDADAHSDDKSAGADAADAEVEQEGKSDASEEEMSDEALLAKMEAEEAAKE